MATLGRKKKCLAHHSIIIHSTEHAMAALSAARSLDCHVVLMSALGGGAYLGAAVFRDMVNEAARHCPDVKFSAVLDCADDPGLALGALRQGIKCVRICVSDEVKAKIADIAAQYGGVVYEEEDDALDMLEVDDNLDAREVCRRWLKNEKSE